MDSVQALELELENQVAELEVLRARHPDDKQKAEQYVRLLDQRLLASDGVTPSSITTLQRLSDQCQKFRILPPSCVLPEIRNMEEQDHISDPETSRIYLGVLGSKTVAIKVIRVVYHGLREEAEKTERYQSVIWKTLRHPNLVPFLGLCLKFPLAVVTPWMSNGNAKVYLVNHPTADRSKMILEISLGLQYLHNLGIVHSNLKASNVLMSDEHQACLTDYGQDSRFKHSGAIHGTGSVRNTVAWMAPELFGESSITEASDIYALGMVIWELFTGRDPFDDCRSSTIFQLMVMILDGHRPLRPVDMELSGFNDTLWTFIQSCWAMNPAERPKSFEVFGLISSKVEQLDSTRDPEDVAELIFDSIPPPQSPVSMVDTVSSVTIKGSVTDDIIINKPASFSPEEAFKSVPDSSNIDKKKEPNVIRTGMARVKGTGFLPWSTRWLLLNGTELLVFTKDVKVLKAVIALHQIVNVERLDWKPYCLRLSTKARQIDLMLQNDEELYDWLYDLYEDPLRKLGISHPWNFQHIIHVCRDPVTHKIIGAPTLCQAPSKNEAKLYLSHVVRTGQACLKGNYLLWSKRWLVLKNTELLIFKNKDAKVPKITVALDGIIGAKRLARNGCYLRLRTKLQCIDLRFGADEELYDWLYEIYEARSTSDISHPVDFKHEYHAYRDPITQEYRGVPEPWQVLLDRTTGLNCSQVDEKMSASTSYMSHERDIALASSKGSFWRSAQRQVFKTAGWCY